MSWRRKQGWLSAAIVAATAAVGYLFGLLVRQWDEDSSPWTFAAGMTVPVVFAVAGSRRNVRQIDLLTADPHRYVQDHRLAEDNRLLQGWLLAANLLIAGMLAAVLLVLPERQDGHLLEGIFVLTEVLLWGSLIWSWLAVRRPVETTGRHTKAAGRGRVARSRLVLDCPYAEAREALEDGLADRAAALPGASVRRLPPATG